MTSQPLFREFQVKTAPVTPAEPNAIYYVKADGDTTVQAYVTDKNGVPFPFSTDDAAQTAAEAARDAAIQSATYAEAQKVDAQWAANRAAAAYANVVNSGGQISGYTQQLDGISLLFNGARTTFSLTLSSLPVAPPSAVHVLVDLGGVLQGSGADYSVSGSVLTFATAPPAGMACRLVHLRNSSEAPEAADIAALMELLSQKFPKSGGTISGPVTLEAQSPMLRLIDPDAPNDSLDFQTIDGGHYIMAGLPVNGTNAIVFAGRGNSELQPLYRRVGSTTLARVYDEEFPPSLLEIGGVQEHLGVVAAAAGDGVTDDTAAINAAIAAAAAS